MKRLIFLLFVSGVLRVSPLHAQIITENPKVEEQSAPYVTITKVELTDQYTIVDLLFKNPKNQSPGNYQFPFPGMPQSGGSQIWLDPNTRLYKPGEIDVRFKFIKAEGIPTRERRSVGSGEEVAFRAYFERLTPGIEIFDFYEGRSDGRGQTWNFYGIHAANPKKAVRKPAEVITQPEVKEETNPAEPAAEITGLAIIKGVVYDNQTKKAIKSTIAYKDEGDSVSTSFSSGNYRLSLEKNSHYTLLVSSPGYLSKTVELNEEDLKSESTLIRDIYLLPLAEGVSFTLDKIYFETSKYELLQESFKELDELVSVMKANRGMRIKVEGHTDNVGDFDKNLELSRKRAQAVKDYLRSKGIDEGRVEVQGYGQTRPVTSGQSEEEKSKNRRVEIVILKA